MFSFFYRDLKIAVEERGWKMPLGAIRLIFKFFLNYILTIIAHNVPSKLVASIHRLRGVKIGKGVFIDRSVIIDEAYPENIVIEDDVRIAAGVIIMSHIKAGIFLREHYLPMKISKVRICKYSFIGVNVSVTPGVVIGEAAVVVSGSVVTTNVKPYTVVAGSPAKFVKCLEPLKKENARP